MKPKLTNMMSIVLTAIIAFTSLSGCNATKTASSSIAATKNEINLQQYGNVSARLFGLMTFEGYGQILAVPSEFLVPPISISWMGLIFNGTLERTGPGSDITYQVHGSVSADGKWVESMTYSTQIIRTSAYSGDFYRVTLRNVQLVQGFDSKNTTIAYSNKNGSDSQRFVAKIEYASGSLGGTETPPIINDFTYIKTDWGNSSCLATLDLVFALGPGTQNTGGPATIPGGM